MPALQVRFFGGFELEWDNGEPVSLPSRAARQLLAYLIAHHQHLQTRSHLIALFWPDSDERSARRQLSQALWRIGQALGENGAGMLVASNDHVQFKVNKNTTIDTLEFERALRSPNHAEWMPALGWYRGDFLNGWFEDWVLEERQRLRDAYLKALETASKQSETAGQLDQALVYARQLVLHDPLFEAAHRQVMRLLTLLGRGNEALEQFEKLKKILAQELGVAPEKSTLDLRDTIANQHTGDTTNLTPPLALGQVPFVGRERERQQWLLSFERTPSQGQVILLEGEAGIGKSRALQELMRDAQWRGMTVVVAQGLKDHAVAYGVLGHLLEGLLGAVRVAQLSHTLGASWSKELLWIVPSIAQWQSNASEKTEALDAQKLQAALLMCLQTLGELGPQVLVLDDAHWGDEVSILALTELATRLPKNLNIVLAYRPDEARAVSTWPALQALDALGHTTRITLGALPDQHSSDLLHACLGTTQSPEFLQEVVQASNGNPFFLLETLRALIESNVVYRNKLGLWQSEHFDALPIGQPLQATLEQRIASLGSNPRHVLCIAATLGLAPLAWLCQTSQLSNHETLEAIDTLLRRGLLLETEGRLQVAHDLLRQHVLSHANPNDLETWHERAAQTLQAVAPERVEVLAHHWSQTHNIGASIRCFYQSAERAFSLCAYRAALQFAEKAIALAESNTLAPSTPTMEDLLNLYDNIADYVGDPDKQLACLKKLEVLVTGNLEKEYALCTKYSHFFTKTGNIDDGIEWAKRGIQTAQQLGNGTYQARSETDWARALMWRGQPQEAIPILLGALRHRQQHQQRGAEAQLHWILGNAYRLIDQYDNAKKHLHKAQEIYVQLERRYEQALVEHGFGFVYLDERKLEQAEDHFQRFLQILNELELAQDASTLGSLADIAYLRQRYKRSFELCEQAIALALETQDLVNVWYLRLKLLKFRFFVLGETTQALELAQAALEFFQKTKDQTFQNKALWFLAEMQTHVGDLEAARLHLAQIDLKETSPNHQLCHEIKLALKAGDFVHALVLAKTLKTHAPDFHESALIAQVHLHNQQPKAALDELAQRSNDANADPEEMLYLYRLHWLLHQAHSMLGHSEAKTHLGQAKKFLDLRLQDFDDLEKTQAFAQLAEYSEILNAWEGQHVERLRLSLPRVGTPTGRPLRPTDFVIATLKVLDPQDQNWPEGSQRRQHQLQRVLQEASAQGASPTVDDLAALLHASRATIKRDLATLREQGVEVTTRGSRSASFGSRG